ncbi:acyl-CoA synthetase [Mycolicibacterium moriokaense]|uniref:Fatty-acid--CoA ligase FadD4 n=1 Tax=Mycolicibacterium moriokaense TaxID=39691 RepID=A0AAD1M7A0_9MYCO|nr:fatty-acid--CoA ligase FadD4 [Mycolicibacterium moriokaense]MCV7041594.1 AMP-binding protein [Mycolicibacterium moriokaense]ORB16465.1 acyl-CoA synthetase [Mycolicibacterium moriokaense]BBX03707.1 fatty-acid--CoA ligase FadD4 [Mycolicibacterium moriokaense]
MQLRDHVGSPKPAVVLHPSGTVVTFAELEARANQLAHLLRRAGLRPSDTVAILMENNHHVHAAMWAARRSGLYYTLVNTHLTASEVAYMVGDSGAKAVISSHAMRAVCEQLPTGALTIALLADGELAGWQRYPDCVAGEPETPIADECDGLLLQYSAGSTGRPKGIRRPLSSASPTLTTPVFGALGVTEDSVYLSPAPIYHTAPAMWTMAAQAVGATTVVMERFDAERALESIERYGVTHAQFVPSMFVRMLRLPEETRRRYNLSSLQRVVHAAAPCPPEIKRQMIDWWGPIVDEYYGSSEGAGISFIRAEEWLERPGSVGKPMLGVPHILDEHGVELPAGQIGEIYYEGGYPFEYLNDQAKTADSRSPQGWVTVGDVGYVDDDGYLYLTDRRNHMIISGGVNIYPQEAENMLVSHPLVVDAAVFGLPDDVMGQSVKAVVQLVDPALGNDALAAELIAWLRDRLAHYKCPRSISFERELPRTDAGKLYKQRLIDKFS